MPSRDRGGEPVRVYEYVTNDTLYIISNAFSEDYNEFKHDIPDAPALLREITSIYSTESQCDDCGYAVIVSGYTPATITLYTSLDTIQYTTLPSPELFTAIIHDTLFGSSNIRCGRQVHELFRLLSLDRLYYDFSRYNTIMLIPQLIDNLSLSKNDCIILPDMCFLLKLQNGIIQKYELRQFDYSGKNLISDFILL